MLFWIPVIIAALALITLLISEILSHKAPSKEMQELLRLRKAYENAKDLWLYDHSSNSQLRENYHKTNQEYQSYLVDHPNIEDKYGKRQRTLDNIFAVSGVTAIIAGVVVIIMLLVIAINCMATPMTIAAREADRETLMYEFTHDVYSDNGDDVVGKKELYNQIRDFNTQLASDHRAAKDFWVGIFVPDAYLDIEPIPLS
jgi:NADH:ubiquinone oxidoreductase subunit 3 (subunit A)